MKKFKPTILFSMLLLAVILTATANAEQLVSLQTGRDLDPVENKKIPKVNLKVPLSKLVPRKPKFPTPPKRNQGSIGKSYGQALQAAQAANRSRSNRILVTQSGKPTQQPDGTWVYPDGTNVTVEGVTFYPDGTTVYPDGTTGYPDGTNVWATSQTGYPDSTTVYPDGTIVYPDGTVIAPNGSVVPPQPETIIAPDQDVPQP